jgi:uncharacterized protein (DUF58 family)
MASLKAIEPDCALEGAFFARMNGGLRLKLSDKRPRRQRCLEVHLEIPDCHAEPGFYEGGTGEVSPSVVLPIRPEKRGWTKIVCVALRTSYPFGFLEKTRRFPVSVPFLVAPHPSGYEEPKGGSGSFSDLGPKSGLSSPSGARPYIAGDSTNRIHWKRTAQRGEPWIRLFEGDQPKGMLLELDLSRWEAGAHFEAELERLSGAILQARLQKMDVVLNIIGRHGRTERAGHIAAWRALGPLEAEGSGLSPDDGGGFNGSAGH